MERLHAKRFWIGLAALACLAAVFFWYATPHGLALVNDTVQYIDGARNIIQGNGYSRLTGWGGTTPITNFPPFYSIVLSVFMQTGIPPIQATWWMSLVFLIADIFLVGILGRKLTGSGWAGLFTSLLLPISDPFFRHFLFGLTEPVFLFCFFLALLLLVPSGKRHPTASLFAAGVFAGLAYLTRYIGITLYATGVLFLFLISDGMKARIKSCAVFLGGALPFFLGWTIRNMIVTGNPVNRQIRFHPLPADKIQEGIMSFWGWLLPEPFHIIDRFINIWGILLVIFLAVYAAAVISALVILLKKRDYRERNNLRLGWLLALQGMVYLVVLAVTILFIDASVNFETRILMPVYNLLALLLVAGVFWLWRRGKAAKVFAIIVAVGLALSFSEDTMDTVKQWRQHGQGFAHESWTESETVKKVRELQAVDIFTNRPQAINLLTGRGSYILLSPINAATQLPREGYETERENIRRSVKDGKTVLVIFNYRDLVMENENSWMLKLTEELPVLFEYNSDIIFGSSAIK